MGLDEQEYLSADPSRAEKTSEMKDELNKLANQGKGGRRDQNLSDGTPFKEIEDSTRTVGKIYATFIGFMTYYALTIFSVSDRQMFLDERTRLPIVNVEVPIKGFFVLSPFVLLIIFLYLQPYLHRHQQLLRGQEPPKRPLYPWIINMCYETDNRGLARSGCKRIVNICLWISPIIILNLNSFCYLRKHDPFFSYVVTGIALMGTIIILTSKSKYDQHEESKNKVRLPPFGISGWFLVTIPLLILILVPITNKGIHNSYHGVIRARTGSLLSIPQRLLNLDLSKQKLINEPSIDYPDLHWGNLEKSNLQNADLRFAILTKADLTNANLRGANLYRAKLREASFVRTNLSGATLVEATLTGARFVGTEFSGSTLVRANLSGAVFDLLSLEEVNLLGATLVNARFHAVDLSGANLMDTDFTKASLVFVNLDRANLSGANFSGANLRNASFTGTGISNNNSRLAIELAVRQLSTTRSLYKATIKKELLGEIRKKHPQLLKPLIVSR